MQSAPSRRTRRVEATGDPAKSGGASTGPVWVEVVDDLTFGEIKRLLIIEQSSRLDAAWPLMAPYVVSWSLTAVNRETGDVEPLPSPAVAGSEIFGAAEPWVTGWIMHELTTVRPHHLEAIASVF